MAIVQNVKKRIFPKNLFVQGGDKLKHHNNEIS